MKDNVPLLDLVALHEEIEEELLAVVRTALKSARFAGGPMVEGFESDFAEFCDVSHCIGVSSGTDALRFALIAAGIRKGDVVVTVPNTFVATTEAIVQAGAIPEFVEVDEHTSNLDPARLREFFETRVERDEESGRPISRRNGRPVTCIVPVHLYGQMADMDPILELAESYKLTVVEDACQAHDGEYFSQRHGVWKRAGSMGDAAAFSFYPGKNLGACGEAGAVTTNCESLADMVRMLRDHGQKRKYFHSVEGYNGRLDSIQGGILQVKLRSLPDWTESRRNLALRYHGLLSSMEDIRLPTEADWVKSVFHLYVIRAQDRDSLVQALTEAGIGTGLHYPVPLHLQEAHKNLGYSAGDFPIAEKAAKELLSLPMYPHLSFRQLERVVDVIRDHYQRTSGVQSLLQSEKK